jgi:hypothetical protein
MKLYLVAPKRPDGFDLSAKAAGALRAEATLKGVKMPWPFTHRRRGPAVIPCL